MLARMFLALSVVLWLYSRSIAVSCMLRCLVSATQFASIQLRAKHSPITSFSLQRWYRGQCIRPKMSSWPLAFQHS